MGIFACAFSSTIFSIPCGYYPPHSAISIACVYVFCLIRKAFHTEKLILISVIYVIRWTLSRFIAEKFLTLLLHFSTSILYIFLLVFFAAKSSPDDTHETAKIKQDLWHKSALLARCVRSVFKNIIYNVKKLKSWK